MTLRNYLITGGAGFIGTNYVARLLEHGHSVTVLDNLSRSGSLDNLCWLKSRFGDQAFRFVEGDVRDAIQVAEAIQSCDVVVHLAAQVAVTTSIEDPRFDFEVNASGTLNILEAARHSVSLPIVLYGSTNKVYGSLPDLELVETRTRYRYADLPYGISEAQPLSFHSPYGCSKGAADQYVQDYARVYGVPTVVFRQSCIYGPWQHGTEEQGWLAWLLMAARDRQRITIYGDGKQTRDILFVDDLLDAYEAAIDRIQWSAGQVYNIGGGPSRTLSVWAEYAPMLAGWLGREIDATWAEARPGDQKSYVSDIRKAERDLGWIPKTSLADGLRQLRHWAFQQSIPELSMVSMR